MFCPLSTSQEDKIEFVCTALFYMCPLSTSQNDKKVFDCSTVHLSPVYNTSLTDKRYLSLHRLKNHVFLTLSIYRLLSFMKIPIRAILKNFLRILSVL
jgi:hypothetical protein